MPDRPDEVNEAQWATFTQTLMTMPSIVQAGVCLAKETGNMTDSSEVIAIVGMAVRTKP
jgi:hypothetical protein